jgi:hypothetical protein
MKLLTLILAIMLSGCATTPDLQWRKVYPASETYTWTRVSPQTLEVICGIHRGGCVPTGEMGKKRCNIYSTLSHDEAQTTFATDGMFFRDHEVKHCEGYVH